jgi:arylsulfatase A-like enzyme
MAAIGPDFKSGFVDEAPVGNADIAPTLARILGVTMTSHGKLTGRALSESLKGGQPVKFEHETIVSPRAENGQATVLNLQRVGSTAYFDAAGFAGRTVGLEAPPQP